MSDRFNTTRDGKATGKANERTMAGSTLDGGCQTRIRTMPDGTTTMLRTRGGFYDFTTFGPEVEPVKEKPVWAYGFYPVKLVGTDLASDTTTIGGAVAPPMSLATGSKTRRKGLRKNADGTTSLKAGVSAYDWYGDADQLSGPGFWYAGKRRVTWTVFSSVYYFGVFQENVLYWVKYGRRIIQVLPADIKRNNTLRIIAACRVRDESGAGYIRVALSDVEGKTQSSIHVLDFSVATGAQVGSSSFGGGTTATVDGYTFSYIVPDRCAWSPDGKTLIAATRVSSTAGTKALLLSVTRPTSGSPVITAGIYAPPVAPATLPAPTRTDTTSTLASGTTYSGGTLTGAILISITHANGTVTNVADPDPGSGWSMTTELRRVRTITETSSAEQYSIERVGFDATNSPCCVLRTLRTDSTLTNVRYTDLYENTTKGGAQEAVFTDQWGDQSRVRWPTTLSYTLRETGFEGRSETTEMVHHTYTLHWCVGAAVAFTHVHEFSVSPHVTSEILKERQRTGSGSYSGGSYTETWGADSPDRKTITTTGTSGATVMAALTPIAADFTDKVLAIHEYGPIWRPTVHDYEEIRVASTDALVSVRDDTQPPGPAPTSFEQKFKIRRGLTGDLQPEHVFTHTEFPGGNGDVAWSPIGKELLAMHGNQAIGAIWGRHFKAGNWRPVRLDTAEPDHSALPISYTRWNINPFG